MKLLLLVPFAALLGAAFQPVARQSTTAPAGDGVFKIDSVHSSVMFRIKHIDTTWFYGAFGKVDGSFDLREGGKVEVTIPVDSVDTRDEGRDKHVRGPDFFDGKQFPEIKFTSSAVKPKTGDEFEVTGELEMHGKKVPLSCTVQKTGEGDFHGKRVGYETKFTLKRGDFGLGASTANTMLSDEVTLLVSVEGMQSAGKQGGGR